MKKIIPLLTIATLLSGCETTQPNYVPSASDPQWYAIGTEWFQESNQNTPNSQNPQNKETTYQILQVLRKGSLALKCEYGPNLPCNGLVVFIPKKMVKKPYDGLKVTILNPKVVDTYSYVSKSEDQKTVPVLSGTVQ